MRTISHAISILTLVLAGTAIGAESDSEGAVEPRPSESEKLESFARDFEEAVRKLATSEPTLCYRLAGGGGMTVGLAVELCSGTTDALKTLACFDEAFKHPDSGGLGLSRGLAVDLCKSNSQIN